MALFVLHKLIAQPSSGARCLILGRILRLLPYVICANSEGSGETARMRRFAWAFAGRICDKYHNLMSWLKYWCTNDYIIRFTCIKNCFWASMGTSDKDQPNAKHYPELHFVNCHFPLLFVRGRNMLLSCTSENQKPNIWKRIEFYYCRFR